MTRHLNVTVIGGGNIGTQVACMCAAKGCDVIVYSSKPEAYDGTLEIVDELDNIISGKINKATSSVREAMVGVEMLFVTYPAFKLKQIAEMILPYIRKGTIICVMPGTGGAEFAFRDCIKAGATLCGLQRVPSVARLEKYGKKVRCEGLRDKLYLAAIPNYRTEEITDIISFLWEIPCIALPNYLSVTLTPSNPILHTTRLCSMFRDYQKGIKYNKNPLFYGEWDDESSKLLLDCDEELQQMCKKLNRLDLKDVRSLKSHYESDTISKMTAKLSSIQSLHNLSSPMKRIEGGWIPDFDSRYFTADFPYGLAIIEELANILSMDVPNIRKTMDWYRKVTGNLQHFKFADYGINDVKDIYNLYNSEKNI